MIEIGPNLAFAIIFTGAIAAILAIGFWPGMRR